MNRRHEVTEDEKDRIKLVRSLVLKYVDSSYNLAWDDYNIYNQGAYFDDGWWIVKQNVARLAMAHGIHIELDQYPKTKLITITLTPDE